MAFIDVVDPEQAEPGSALDDFYDEDALNACAVAGYIHLREPLVLGLGAEFEPDEDREYDYGARAARGLRR